MNDGLERRLKIELVIRFGSTARGTAREDSDVDLGVWAEHSLSLAEQSALVAELALRFGLPEDKIDLVDLRTASPLLLHEVAEGGELLLGAPDDFTRFRVRAWKIHQDTARLRRARERHLSDVLDVP